MKLSSDLVAARLAEKGPHADLRSDPARPGGRAAVAAVLRFPAESPEVLLIRRAERPGDRWSGQIAFPGGREAPQDSDLVATATRETREEIGLDLGRAGRLLGRLAPMPTAAKRGRSALTISPFVFELVRDEPLRLGPEADAYFWLPLARAASGELDSRHRHWVGPVPLGFPCWRFCGEVVWGLTYEMLRRLLEAVAPVA